MSLNSFSSLVWVFNFSHNYRLNQNKASSQQFIVSVLLKNYKQAEFDTFSKKHFHLIFLWLFVQIKAAYLMCFVSFLIFDELSLLIFYQIPFLLMQIIDFCSFSCIELKFEWKYYYFLISVVSLTRSSMTKLVAFLWNVFT
jgi:uncharacterized membrane protein